MPDGLITTSLLDVIADAYKRMTMSIAEIAAEDSAEAERLRAWIPDATRPPA